MRLKAKVLTAVVGGIAVAGFAVFAALAYACFPAAYITLDSVGYHPGAQVAVTGHDFAHANAAPVTIAVDDTSVGQVTVDGAGGFSFSFRLPSGLAQGTHLVHARTVTASGYRVDARQALTIAVPQSARAPAVSSPAPKAPASSPSKGSARALGRSARPPHTSPWHSSSGVHPRTRATGARDSLLGVRPGSAAVVRRAGQHVFAGSLPASEPRAAQRQAARATAQRRGGRAPSERSASADLWSGMTGAHGPGLGAAGAAGEGSGPGFSFALALVLLGAGFLTLVGGFSLATLDARRGRARVRR